MSYFSFVLYVRAALFFQHVMNFESTLKLIKIVFNKRFTSRNPFTWTYENNSTQSHKHIIMVKLCKLIRWLTEAISLIQQSVCRCAFNSLYKLHIVNEQRWKANKNWIMIIYVKLMIFADCQCYFSSCRSCQDHLLKNTLVNYRSTEMLTTKLLTSRSAMTERPRDACFIFECITEAPMVASGAI